jgi:hypothetical protein
MATDTVSRDMFTVLHGQPAPVVTRWTYAAADPFAVTLGVRARGAVLEVDRDLLAEFVDASAGVVAIGDESAHMDLDAEISKITSRTV